MEEIEKVILLDRLDNLIKEYEEKLVNQEFGEGLFKKDLKEVGALMEDLKLNILKTAMEKKRVIKEKRIIKLDKERRIIKEKEEETDGN